MVDTKDDTTPLEYLVAGLVVLSFGLLYYLLNHNSGVWSGSYPKIPAYSGSTYIPEVAEEKQGLAAWLKTSPKTELPKTDATLPTTGTTPGKQATLTAHESVTPEPKPDKQLTDAIARQQEQTAQLQSSLTNELTKLRNEVAQHKAEISQLKQIAETQDAQIQQAEMQKVVRPEITGQPAVTERNFENELEQLISSKQTNKAITFDKIFFDTGSARLKSESLPQIEALAKQLVNNEQTKILIRGHSDNTGSVQQNSLLSLSRSGSLKKALSNLGVDSNRINVEGVGPLEPIASNETAEGREKNRRIELIVIE